MRNLHEREREKMMQIYVPPPNDPERYLKEVELREQKIKRDFNTPLPVWYIVVSIIIGLCIIVAILGANVFHFW